jgi:large subunit ribosomal protein L28
MRHLAGTWPTTACPERDDHGSCPPRRSEPPDGRRGAARLARTCLRRISFDDRSGSAGTMTDLTSTQWSDPVASVCDVCGKRPGFGNNVSHSHRRTPRRWNPNIQRVRAVVGGTPRRLNVCTSCIKAGKITR